MVCLDMTNASTLLTKSFPREWLWGRYEQDYLTSLQQQIDTVYAGQRNLIINMTWFGPQFPEHAWRDFQALPRYPKWQNVFLVAMVDPPMLNSDQIQNLRHDLGDPEIYCLGNFDGPWHFNFFAPVLRDNFFRYRDQDIYPRRFDYAFINYNRKPRQHRVALVRELHRRALQHLGIITLGRPNRIYDKDETNDLFLSIGQRTEDYRSAGHWFQGEDEFGIPHDVLSLHCLDLWQRHFLYVVSATEFNVWDPIFVSETQFKPMLGLRPFVINGNVRTYQWLEHHGFRTFEQYWPHLDLRDESKVHHNICDLVQYLGDLGAEGLHDLYQQMLPDILHNRSRFWQFALEQGHKIHNIFSSESA